MAPITASGRFTFIGNSAISGNSLPQYCITAFGQKATFNHIGTWGNMISRKFFVNFASLAAIADFFANNGEIRLSFDIIGAVESDQNADWKKLFADVGTVFFSNTATTRSGTRGTGGIGYSTITSTPTLIFTASGLSTYSGDLLTIYASKPSSLTVEFEIYFHEAADGGAGVYDEPTSGEIKIYVDEKKVCSYASPTYSMTGSSSDTYSNEILNSNPLGYWKLNETVLSSGSVINNYGYGGIPCNLIVDKPSVLSSSTSMIPSDTSSSIMFTDTTTGSPNSGIQSSAANSTLAITGKITIEAVVMLTSLNSDGNTICTYTYGHTDSSSASNYLYMFRILNSGVLEMFFEYGTGVNVLATDTTVLSLNTVYHLAVTRDSINKEIKFYINGNLSSTHTYIRDAEDGSSSLSRFAIGGQAAPNGHSRQANMNGKISHVAIYESVLSSTTIYNHYSASQI